MVSGLQWAFQTSNDILVFPASGTGGMESAAANLLSPNERVLVPVIGAFGERFADLAEAFGAQVVRYGVPWGEAADPQDIDEILAKEPEITTVLVTHNETSTGVTNRLGEISQVVRRHGRLLVVDGVSSIGSIDLPVDSWGVDVAITASQKGWMAPPGLTMVSVSKAAWTRQGKATAPRFYFEGAADTMFPSRSRQAQNAATFLCNEPDNGDSRRGLKEVILMGIAYEKSQELY